MCSGLYRSDLSVYDTTSRLGVREIEQVEKGEPIPDTPWDCHRTADQLGWFQGSMYINMAVPWSVWVWRTSIFQVASSVSEFCPRPTGPPHEVFRVSEVSPWPRVPASGRHGECAGLQPRALSFGCRDGRLLRGCWAFTFTR